MIESANLVIGRKLRMLMRAAHALDYEAIPVGSKLIIVGESPPPNNHDIERTSVGRLARLSGDSAFLSRDFVYRTNVNLVNPGKRGRGSIAPNRQEATLAAHAILNLFVDGQDVPVRDDMSAVFLLLGLSTAKAFRMYEEKSPDRYPPYHLFHISTLVKEYNSFPCFVERFIVRVPHPSNANSRGLNKEKVAKLLTAIQRRGERA